MSIITPEVSRRSFLLGTLASLAAVSTARLIGTTTALASIHTRSAYQFQIAPDIFSAVPTAKQKIPIDVYRLGDTQYLQIENLSFPTSYIPTSSVPATREADNISINTSSFDHRYDRDLTVIRDSPVYTYDPASQKMRIIPPHTAVFEKEGLLIQTGSTNLLPYSEGVWNKQSITLAPELYTISWYGSGTVKLEAEAVGLFRNYKKAIPLTRRAQCPKQSPFLTSVSSLSPIRAT